VELIGIFLLGTIAWLWFDSLKAREAAVRAARAICAAEGLLLLDDTVSISGLKPVRGADGRLTLQRSYDFEFSDTGNTRLRGSMVLRGHQLVLFNVGPLVPPRVRTLH
jgi:hypothetical protein